MTEISTAKHKPPRPQYPPAGTKCTTKVTTTRRYIIIKVVCRGFGLVSKEVRLIARSEPLYLGTFKTDETGSLDATIPVPDSLKSGSHHIEIFEAESVTVPQNAPQVVTGATAIPATTMGSPLESIPIEVAELDGRRTVLTGSNLSSAPASSSGSSSRVPLTAAAVGLVGIGAAGLAAARRRRNATDGGGS